MSATADEFPPDHDDLRRHYDATRAEGARNRSNSDFMDRVRLAIADLDSQPLAPTMTQDEFVELYPTKR